MIRRGVLSLFLAVWGLVSIASAADVKTHTVKEGECLSVIAQRFHVSQATLVSINKLSDPDKIAIGQVLKISETGDLKSATGNSVKGKKVKTQKPVTSQTRKSLSLYSQPDSNPVGKESDPIPYIRKMRLPLAVQKQFEIWATGPKPSTVGIITKENNPLRKKGKKVFSNLNAMGYGKDGQVIENVKVLFSLIRDAWYWSMDYEGLTYYLVCDQKCYNWASYISLTMPQVPTKVEKPSKSVDEPARTDKNIEEIFTDKGLSLTGDDKETEIFTTKPDGKPTKSNHKYSPAIEAWLYGGKTWGVSNNNDTGTYHGLSFSLFLDKWKFGDGYFRVGPAIQYVGWMGTSGDVDYDGHFQLLGAEAQYLTGTTKDQLKVLVGDKDGYVYGNGFPYYAHETATLYAIEGAHQWWGRGYQWEIGFRAEIATDNDKSSTWEGRPIPRNEDPANDQSVYSVRAKYTWTKNKNFQPTLEVNGGWKAFNERTYAQIRPGVKLFGETIEPCAWYEWQSGKHDDSYGVGVNINLSLLGENVYKWLTKSKKTQQK